MPLCQNTFSSNKSQETMNHNPNLTTQQVASVGSPYPCKSPQSTQETQIR